MTTLLALTALWFAQQAAVPPPIEQGVANCGAPVYASDRLICSDVELMAAERQIETLWRARGDQASASAWVEDQQAWFRRRALCAFQAEHRACVLAANAERLSVLAAANAGPQAGAVSARCTGAGAAARTLALVRSDTQVAAYDRDGLAWVAIRPAPNWRPFVAWTSGRSIAVRQLDGRRLNCRAIRPASGHSERL